ncbi:MAG: tRNA preQ1(34) S-adenosylmethionine ribosyltransferase-isomerase QueA [Armatimonadota bacterium]
METSEFDYYLPEELIAQTPLDCRHDSGLFVIGKNDNFIHDRFVNIVDYLDENDVLIFNDSKVFNARIFGTKEKTGGRFEFLLLEKIDGAEKIWKTLVNPGRRAKTGSRFRVIDGIFEIEILDRLDEGIRLVKLHYEGDLIGILEKYGKPPTPPYIKGELPDPSLYQTIYAKNYGSIAAPTAGFHFTKEVFNKLKDKNISYYYITLHVGVGTFRPVKAENVKEHVMLSEYYRLDPCVVDSLNKEKQRGRKIVSVGTTAVRALEAASNEKGRISVKEGRADLFIYPGYRFKFVDSLITNFHLPKSTLLMLVSALRGADIIKKAYKEAVDKKYRFYSFGDAMFIR